MLGNQTTATRKHVSTACVACRESKIKCDGASPICSSCKAKRKECQYHVSDDKRKLSQRMAVELLVERVDELARFIRHDHSLEPPPMDSERHTGLIKVLTHLRLSCALSGKDGFASSASAAPSNACRRDASSSPNDNVSPGRPDAGPNDSQQPRQSQRHGEFAPLNGLAAHPLGTDETCSSATDSQQWSHPALGDPVASMGTLNGGWTGAMPDAEIDMFGMPGDGLEVFSNTPASGSDAHRPDNETSRANVDGGNIAEPDCTSALVKELADRIGSLRIGPGGRIQYYGPTSNFNLVDMGAPDNLTVHRSVRHHGPDYLDRLDMGNDVPSTLEDHLVNLYFTWQDPALHVVKRPTYENAKATWREKEKDTPYFSESLQNAMCALGAAFESRHHPTFPTFPKSLADFFADRAKTLLEIELDSPTVATVQALAVLCSHDIGCKRDSRGWLYSGMATRLAFHLALHLDVSSYVSSGFITQEEADLRRDVFWAAYTVDHTWSFQLGRAFRINMESVTLRRPDANESADAIGQWFPYVSASSIENSSPRPDYTVEFHRQRVLLCEIMASLGFALYGNLKMAPAALHNLNVATVSKLLQWKSNLPPVLQIDLDTQDPDVLPHVLLLHMFYYQNIIYAHRPWMSRRDADPKQPQAGEGHDPQHARAMCIDAAVSIAKLLHSYERLYGLSRINIQAVGITCSAALLLIFAVVEESSLPSMHGGSGGAPRGSFSSYGSNRPSTFSTFLPAMHLGTCFRALEAFGSSWESAKQARDFLTLLQRRWELQARRFREGRKANDGQAPDSIRGVGVHASDVVPAKRPRPVEDGGMGLEPGGHRPWPRMGTDMADAADFGMTVDLDWILMGGGETALDGGLGQELLDAFQPPR